MVQKQVKLNNVMIKLERMRRELDNVISYLRDNSEHSIPRCNRCGWGNLRVRMDKTYHCNSCGFDSKGLKNE